VQICRLLKKKRVIFHQALRSCLCSVHQVARLELGLRIDVSWLQDTSHLFTCR